MAYKRFGRGKNSQHGFVHFPATVCSRISVATISSKIWLRRTCNLPLGIMTLEFSQVGDVTDVVAFASILPVGPLNLATG